MNIYHSVDDFRPVPGLVVTIGTFDGVHVGHSKLIQKIRDVAQAEGGQTLILTFFPHPRMVLYPGEHGIELLNTMREKEELLRQAGIDHLIIHPFSLAFSQMDSETFIREIICRKLQTTTLVIGYDHHFGRGRMGNIEDLSRLAPELGFKVEKIEEEDVQNIAVSSTRIRNALKAGDVEQATQLLGRYYTLTGIVEHGRKIGRSLGFPTANLGIPEKYKLLPAEGVYVVQTDVEGEMHYGMLNIGRRPTLEKNGALTIEVYLLDFDREIYGIEITLHLLLRIRPDRTFRNLDELREAIGEDLRFTREFIEKQIT